ncbi:MAG: phytanoyl-CoA dioxygenase family protein [Actinomycetota bacterium]|nr:phytanoyl-CoA dioxygenase family protein [Actinomycetota bacterium]
MRSSRQSVAAHDNGLRRDGFLVLPAFLDDSELRKARTEVELVLAKPLRPGCDRPHNTLVPLRWTDLLVQRVLGAARRIERVVDEVGASDIKWISGYVSVKEPRSPALWWHQDWWCWCHPVTFEPSAPQIALLCYFDKTDERTGALRVLPGSHRRSLPLHALLPDAHAHAEGDLEASHPAMSDHPDQVTVAASAGDAVVIDYRLLHGTHPNTQARRRDCLILNFAPSWRQLPADIRAHLIRHPAQPTEREKAGGAMLTLLPHFSGPRRDLSLSREAPYHFLIE